MPEPENRGFRPPWRRFCLLWAVAGFCCCAAGPAQTLAERAVWHGGNLRPEEAVRLAWTQAWLEGLQAAGDSMAENNAVRLARLDDLQRQGLAALMGLVDVRVVWPRQTDPDDARDGEVVADFAFRSPDGEEISLWLGETEARQRQEEIIAALRRLLPDALDSAARGPLLREEAGFPSGGLRDASLAAAADAPVAEEWAGRIAALEAYALYRRALEDFSGKWEEPSVSLPLVEHALSLAPDELPIRLARSELLLLLDRPRGALMALPPLRAPLYGVEGKERGAAGAGTDFRLHARGLYLRALAQLKAGMPALAEKDMDEALRFAPERAEMWLARGAARQARENFGAMCEDYRHACVFGLCEGLTSARRIGLCLTEAAEQ
jgi:hypothetical protein